MYDEKFYQDRHDYLVSRGYEPVDKNAPVGTGNYIKTKKQNKK